jgi:hypothetical protein
MLIRSTKMPRKISISSIAVITAQVGRPEPASMPTGRSGSGFVWSRRLPLGLRRPPDSAPMPLRRSAGTLGQDPRRRPHVHRHLEQPRGDADRDRALPCPFVGAHRAVDQAAAVGADKRAELVAEERDARERGHVAQAEEVNDEAAHQRHHAEPERAHRRGEYERRRRRGRHHAAPDDYPSTRTWCSFTRSVTETAAELVAVVAARDAAPQPTASKMRSTK